jgi:hypothetical protein
MSAIRPGLAKIVEKVRISWYVESPNTVHHIAENICCIDYTDTWSSKRVHWLCKGQSPQSGTFHSGGEDTLELYTGVIWVDLPITRIHTLVTSKPKTPNTGHRSQLKMNGPLWIISWKNWGYSEIGPCGWPRGITLSQCTMTCLITRMVCCELWLSWKHNGQKICSLRWSLLNRSCPNTTPKWHQWWAYF